MGIGRMKWMAAAATVLVMMFGATVAYGGLRWSGFDPRVLVDDAPYSVTIAVPPGQWCQIHDVVQVTVHKPGDASYELIAESIGGDKSCAVSTSTTFDESGEAGGVHVRVFVPSDHRFPVDVSLGPAPLLGNLARRPRAEFILHAAEGI